MTRTELWEKLWGDYIAKLQRIDELKRLGRYGYQLRMPYKSLAIAEKALLKEFPEAEKYMNPQKKAEMGVYDDDDEDLVDVPRPEGSVKGAVLSHKDLMLIISHARDAMDHGDLYRALELLEVFFEKAHYWLRNFGSDSILQKTMDAARSLAAQVRSKMSQTSLKGPLMGLHTQEEQIQAVDMAADSLARGIDAAASRNLFGLASEVGYLRALADLAISEGVEAVATIAHQNANELVARFGQLYGEIG